jgi:hypothetical protein
MLAIQRLTCRLIAAAVGHNLSASVRQGLHLSLPPFVALMARSLPQSLSQALLSALVANLAVSTLQQLLQQLNALQNI